MEQTAKIHHRRSIRLRGFDYAQTAHYFVTIVAQDRKLYFGAVENGEMQLSTAGNVVQAVWLGLENRFHQLILGDYVVMPNHLHAVLSIHHPQTQSEAGGAGAIRLGDVIGAFKSISVKECILAVRRGEMPPFSGKIWQRNYYEHIIRDEREWEQIGKYIATNPAGWELDEENPGRNRD